MEMSDLISHMIIHKLVDTFLRKVLVLNIFLVIEKIWIFLQLCNLCIKSQKIGSWSYKLGMFTPIRPWSYG